MAAQGSLVDSVCNKAQALIDQTKDEALEHYVVSIRKLYSGIAEKSKVCYLSICWLHS
jgi:hypothetical protein